MVIPISIHKSESQRKILISKTFSLKKGIDYIIEEEINKWINLNV